MQQYLCSQEVHHCSSRSAPKDLIFMVPVSIKEGQAWIESLPIMVVSQGALAWSAKAMHGPNMQFMFCDQFVYCVWLAVTMTVTGCGWCDTVVGSVGHIDSGYSYGAQEERTAAAFMRYHGFEVCLQDRPLGSPDALFWHPSPDSSAEKW
jgi:hypothetical protein